MGLRELPVCVQLQEYITCTSACIAMSFTHTHTHIPLQGLVSVHKLYSLLAHFQHLSLSRLQNLVHSTRLLTRGRSRIADREPQSQVVSCVLCFTYSHFYIYLRLNFSQALSICTLPDSFNYRNNSKNLNNKVLLCPLGIRH